MGKREVEKKNHHESVFTINDKKRRKAVLRRRINGKRWVYVWSCTFTISTYFILYFSFFFLHFLWFLAKIWRRRTQKTNGTLEKKNTFFSLNLAMRCCAIGFLWFAFNFTIFHHFFFFYFSIQIYKLSQIWQNFEQIFEPQSTNHTQFHPNKTQLELNEFVPFS